MDDDPYAEVREALGNPQPFLKPAIQEALRKMSTKELMTAFVKATKMAHPAPWPYGTVLRRRNAYLSLDNRMVVWTGNGGPRLDAPTWQNIEPQYWDQWEPVG